MPPLPTANFESPGVFPETNSPRVARRPKLNPCNEGRELKGQDTGDSFKFCDSASRKFAFLREIRTGADLTLKGGALKVGRS